MWSMVPTGPCIYIVVRAGMLNKIPIIHVYSLKTLDARALGLHFQHLIEPEACPEGAIKMYQ